MKSITRRLWRRYVTVFGALSQTPSGTASGLAVIWRDDAGNLIAVIDENATTVLQPDKVHLCGGPVVDHLARVAARDEARKWFKDEEKQ